MARLRGITVLVTGAPSDLARASVGRLIAEGATVVVGVDAASLEASPLEGLEANIDQVELTVTDPASWEAAAAAIETRHGALHGLVNSASSRRTGSLTAMGSSDLQAMIETNLLGPALGIRTLAPLIRASGGGSIVNVASTEALRGARNAAVFSATNWGLRGLTRSVALELGADGIRVNTVCPSIGLMSSDPASADAVDPSTISDGAQPRSVTMGDVAAMIVFLLSDDSATCTGGDFLVDAGATA